MYAIIKKEFHELDTSGKQLRKFGLVVGGVILVAALFLAYFWNKNIHDAVWALGVILVGLALISARTLLWPYYLWMGIAIVLGSLLAPIILGGLFYTIVAPVGLLKRLFSVKKQTGNSYWIKRDTEWTKESMERLF